MTKEEFDKLYLGKAIHCDTEEKAKEFLAIADSVGYKWFSNHSLIEDTLIEELRWTYGKEKTHYIITNKGVFIGDEEGVIFASKMILFKVIQSIEYQLQPTYKEETIADIIEEIEYHQKAINVLHNRLKRKVKVGK